MCACGNDRRPGLRECCNAVGVANKRREREEKVLQLQRQFENDELRKHPVFTSVMRLTFVDLVPHLDDEGLKVLEDRLNVLFLTMI
ncbi:hypothetical protein ACFX4N_24630 [Priestia sp. YIM B13551]|uniref:hypothetical protein n=1 Tax=Priestia sp. YIM B13551 TaxID=3366306 RepID=UPI00366EFACC